MGVLDVKYAKRQGYGLDPATILLPNHELQGRFAPKPKKVLEMAITLLIDGQKQNITVRANHENHPVLVSGFRRHAAATMINEKRQDPDFLNALPEAARAKLELMGDEPFLLECKLEKINEAQAFMSNVRENVGREDLSPMDNLKIATVLQAQGMSNDDIAAIWGKKAWYVYHLQRLTGLSTRIQELVDQGIISLEVAAKTLYNCPESERDAIVDEILAERQKSDAENEDTPAPEATERITAATLAKAIRKRREGKNGAAPGKSIKRTLAETRKTFRHYIDTNGDEDPITPVFVDLLLYIEGSINERALFGRFAKHFKPTGTQKKTAKN